MSKDQMDRRAYEKYRKHLAEQDLPKRGFWKITGQIALALLAVFIATLVNSISQALMAQYPRWVGLTFLAVVGVLALGGWFAYKAWKKRRR